MLVQKLRLKRGWSQQQLAEASGVSARTIQRIEAGGQGSTESLKSIAAVFEVDFSDLSPERNMIEEDAASTEHEEQEAFRFVRKLRGFYFHLARYVIVSLVLVMVNLLVSPGSLWVLWVIGGWGIGVVVHASRVFRPDWLLGPQWERAQVEKRLGRPL